MRKAKNKKALAGAGQAGEAQESSLLTSMRKETKNSTQNIMGGALILLSLGFALFWKRRKKATNSALNADSIEVVAIKSLGGKHRLAVVEACGERILLATNDKEVSMLAQLGDTSQKANAFAETLTELDTVEEDAQLVETNKESATQTLDTAAKKKDLPSKSDLAGLLFLRKNKNRPDTDTASKDKGIAA